MSVKLFRRARVQSKTLDKDQDPLDQIVPGTWKCRERRLNSVLSFALVLNKVAAFVQK